LHTFRADIDYALGEALTKVGQIGIKVWICNGEVYGRRDLAPNIGLQPANSKSGQGGGDRDRGDRKGQNFKKKRKQ
jgi:small subunit ribosomal protein S3